MKTYPVHQWCLVAIFSLSMTIQAEEIAEEAPQAFKIYCAACHLPDRELVGPHFVEIQELYPESKQDAFLEWCLNPGKRRPESPQMPSMAHVPKEELIAIHQYILKQKINRVKSKSNKDQFPEVTRPRVVRTFLPKTGPASILVALPTKSKLNFVWDTEQCRLRYLTVGEPNNYPYLRSNGNSLAQPGAMIYEEFSTFGGPLDLEFNGYRIDKNGLPVFIYDINGISVAERFVASETKLMRIIEAQDGGSLPKMLLESQLFANIRIGQKEKAGIIEVHYHISDL